jgi:hypothetical protein
LRLAYGLAGSLLIGDLDLMVATRRWNGRETAIRSRSPGSGAFSETDLWSVTDRRLAAEVADAVALRAQAEAALLARLGEAEAGPAAHARRHRRRQ